MSLQYIKSQKGRDQLLYKGYLHKKERASGDKILWKCADYHKYRCTGRAHTRSGRIIKYVPHMHPPNKREEETDRGVCETENNISGQESVQKAVAANGDALSGATTHKKPRLQNNPKQTIQRLRACLNATRHNTSDTRTPAATSDTRTPATTSDTRTPAATSDTRTPATTSDTRTPAATSDTRTPATTSDTWTPAATSDIRTPAVIAGTTLQGLPLPPTLTSGLQEPSASSGGSVATPILCPELEASNASRLPLHQASQEASRQRFRSGTILLGEAPWQILSQLSKAAHQWLRPQEQNKEQIVDLVILEQFLDVLPTETQIWVRSREPGNSKEAAELAEAYVREQRPADCSVQEQLTFEDVSLHFTAEEWALLDNRQKTLYWNVMHQNYDNVAFLAGGRIDGLSEGEAPQHEIPETVVVLSEMNDEKLSQGSELSLVKKDCLNRQQKNSSGEEGKAINVRTGLRELDGDTVNLNVELGAQTRCISPDCEKPRKSLILLESQESPSKDGPKSVVLSGELFHISERNHSKNPEVKNEERQNSVERQQPICVGNEEKCILSRSPLLQAQYVCTDNAGRDASLILGNNHNTLSGEDVEEEEGVFHSSEQGMSLDDVPICSVLSSADLNGTADLIRENQNVLTSHVGNNTGNKAKQNKPIVFANSTEEPVREIHYPSGQLSPVAQGACTDCEDQAESLEHTDSQKINHGEDLNTCPKYDRPFPQNSNPATQHNCSDSGNSGGLPTSIKPRKVVRKGKYFKGRNTCIKSILRAHQRIQPSGKLWKLWEDWGCYRQSGCRLLKSGKVPRETLKQNTLKSSSQNCEAQHLTTEPVKICSKSDSNPKHLEPQQRSSTPPHLGSTAAKPTLVHLITLLQQVAADTAEIKSSVSSLHTTITGIHNAIGSISGCTDEAEHRISSLEDASRNTRAQLVQHCSDIKAIEAKLVGKGIQHNVIAGLWSSLKISRGASPLNLSPNS